MKFIGWNAESGFVEVDAKNQEDAELRIELNQDAVLLGKKDEIIENILQLLKEQKIELHVVVDMWGSCFQNAHLFTYEADAKKKYEALIIDDFGSVEQYEQALEDSNVGDKSEAHMTTAVIN